MLFIRNNIIRFFLMFFSIFFPFFSRAQDVQKKSSVFQVGFISSISASTLNIITGPVPAGIIVTAQPYDKIPKLGYKAGAMIRLNLSSHIFLMSGFSFVKDKTKISMDLSPGSSNTIIDNEERNSWIEMPAYFNYIVNPGFSKKVFFGLGLSARRLLNAKSRITSTIANTTYYGLEYSIYDNLNKWNMFGMGQVGVELPTKTNKLLVTITFERSLFKMVHQNDNITVQSDFKINSLSMNFIYLFF